MGSRQVSRTAIVATTPEKIFGLLADPAQPPLIDGSGTVRAAQPGGPDRLSLGAWRHFNGHRWRWRLEPLDGGRTEVTETFDWSTAKFPLAITLSPFPRKNAQGIEKTLARLTELFPA
ncbi:dimethyladenosine transferase [Amycolatopsis sp. SID8362]|uniref:dimethyladenosine transferase n=1 Tax=Amycolatopsis sp. SID8362 TaxID=2690346 RepID=UPI00136B014C|nr:dimethyladenosine transferase [Amycolatopsis sp. SID8362]NBH07169.1 dimethyladenosine transferase [Amycolatopsis sp. SID8362]NED43865.1 dimethyladenosine transferase [Amycolatopsis sp. SID8362]